MKVQGLGTHMWEFEPVPGKTYVEVVYELGIRDPIVRDWRGAQIMDKDREPVGRVIHVALTDTRTGLAFLCEWDHAPSKTSWMPTAATSMKVLYTMPPSKTMRINLYVQGDKHDLAGKGDVLRLDGNALGLFMHLLDEVELVVEVNLETGEGKFLAVNGKKISDEDFKQAEG